LQNAKNRIRPPDKAKTGFIQIKRFIFPWVHCKMQKIAVTENNLFPENKFN